MPAHDNLIGQVFGKLTVLSKSGARVNNGATWFCQCECGNTVEALGRSLKNGRQWHCGCSTRRGEHSKKKMRFDEDYVWDRLYRLKKADAKSRGFLFTITFSQFRQICSQPCEHCGLPPSNHFVLPGPAGRDCFYSGIDRRNNDFGYIDGNVIPSCRSCNMGKNTDSQEDYYERCRRVARLHP